MGLDITAYNVATLTPEHERVEACYEADHVLAYTIDPSFHRSVRGLELDRCYAVGSSHVTARYRGAYSGYGRLRERISIVLTGLEPEEIWREPDRYADRPFFELIHFADNEGTIGPEAAVDLAVDFAAGRDQWLKATADDVVGRDRHDYDALHAVFHAASGTGLVRYA